MATTINKVKKIGNGHFIPVSAAAMEELKLRAGQELMISTEQGALLVRAVDDEYVATRAMAATMVDRYRRTLVKLGREGEAP
ncbi:hypothetical protein N6L24_07425 [Cognatishimia sp. SS12]|uniref:AbrB/MazE/SpoVT family DNA-binding domain-containing protein n=1 Tax=Cognatishimia sp. SS12 TaxID=2979465 RepID=UPI00233132C8|nr:hypothetical protein [Cognatishimia sp. SS12]MDC0738104.1 hypothetical protein [Cognatishimia sp. SS12]